MKLDSYKVNVVEYMREIFHDRENLIQQVKALYKKGNFNNFEVYAAACIMRVVNRYTHFSLYDTVMNTVPGVIDAHFITLYKAAFKEFTGCSLIGCVN